MKFSSRWADLAYYWLPPILWGLAIIGMSGDLGSYGNTIGLLKTLLARFGLSASQMETLNFYLRKTGHFTAYAIFFILWYRAFKGYKDYGIFRSLLWSLFFCLLVAAVDEYHQSFFSSRTGNIWDVALDMTGASLAALLTLAVSPFFGPRRHICAVKRD